MLSRIKMKKPDLIFFLCSCCLTIVGCCLEFSVRSNIHFILKNKVYCPANTIKFSETMMKTGVAIFWLGCILLLFALVKRQGIGTRNMLIRITVAGLSVIVIKLLFFVGFHDFSFTWISFLMEAIIMYVTFLFIGSIIWVFTHFKILKRNKSLDE